MFDIVAFMSFLGFAIVLIFAMARKDTDNLLKVISEDHISLLSGSGIVSVELDLELPRGFVAKIRKVIFQVTFVESVTLDQAVAMALIRDPDDITTTSIPFNSVQHDVIAELDFWTIIDVAAIAVTSATQKIYTFSELEDIITARNMRFNAVASGATQTISVKVAVHYTLEKVTDMEILDLLDIL